jgi:predicted transcriptional regulator
LNEGKKIPNSRSPRRDRLDILAQMLDIIKDGPLKKQIMDKANLSFDQLNDYLAFLLNSNLTEQFNVAGKEIYIITGSGLDFLQMYNKLTKMLEPIENFL